MSAALRVLATGPNATIQDLGRPGWFSAGVGVSGAADVDSLRRVNRLLGNDEDAAGLECVLGGLQLEALADVTVAVAGAPATVTVDGASVATGSAIRVLSGQRLALGMATAGLRAYVGVRGGIAVEPVLGSRSRDTLAGLGPEPLQVDDRLPVGAEPDAPVSTDVDPGPVITNDPVVVRVRLGPRQDWFTRPEDLFVGDWTVTDRLDRVGTRLARPDRWPALIRRDERELPTEGMPLGAIQVPPSGEPVVFLADHPITGGYPVIGVVHHADLGRVAQARPGQQLIFVSADRPTSMRSSAEPMIMLRGRPTAQETAAITTALSMINADLPAERGL